MSLRYWKKIAMVIFVEHVHGSHKQFEINKLICMHIYWSNFAISPVSLIRCKDNPNRPENNPTNINLTGKPRVWRSPVYGLSTITINCFLITPAIPCHQQGLNKMTFGASFSIKILLWTDILEYLYRTKMRGFRQSYCECVSYHDISPDAMYIASEKKSYWIHDQIVYQYFLVETSSFLVACVCLGIHPSVFL